MQRFVTVRLHVSFRAVKNLRSRRIKSILKLNSRENRSYEQWRFTVCDPVSEEVKR